MLNAQEHQVPVSELAAEAGADEDDSDVNVSDKMKLAGSHTEEDKMKKGLTMKVILHVLLTINLYIHSLFILENYIS